jgi:hypothetical protein
MLRQLILAVPVMRTEAALPSCRRPRQSPAFGATIEDNFVSAIVQNASRRSFNKGFIPCVSEMQYVRIIGEETGMDCGFLRFSLRLHVAFPSCGLQCCEQVLLRSLLNRSHEVGVPSDDVVSNLAFVFHRVKEITAGKCESTVVNRR